MAESEHKIRIIPLGGVDEFGKNITVVEYGEDMLVVDCGSSNSYVDAGSRAADQLESMGIHRLRAVAVTHYHADHTNGLYQLLARLEVQTLYLPDIEDEYGVRERLLRLAEKNGIALEREGDGVMIGSDALIYRMLFNLAENAVKYNRPDGSVRISVAQEDKMLHIRVADTGSGIPEEFRRSIFQPFFRVDKSRSREYGGVGLGLSLVWEIAGLHGGSVRVEESSERGTVFAVELPAQ